ncbi:hypothetical protein NDU88_003782 [Pleurodeles waltl]|uniref:Uncharacterized protein n=1 Tax=Pleurodeles waltl TaxID=8319 RepID=A0AAV7W750_PLEWA|nr:hypothetical protein NDU88_003782 [Pleurodeles waltl]
MVLRPMPPWVPRPFKRIRCLPGPRVLRFREAARRLHAEHAASAAAEIRLNQDRDSHAGLWSGWLLRAGGPLTLGRGRTHGRRPPVTPRPMLLRVLCPAEKICCLPGPSVLPFREAVGRLPEAYAAPAIAEICLAAQSFVLRRPFSSVAKPRPLV